MSNTKRILIADDQGLFAQSLKRVIELSAKDLEVVGVVSNGKEAVAMVEETQPDVVLMDIKMPEMDGVEATRIIHESHPDVCILVLTTFDDDEYVHNAIAYGAKGYLLKDLSPDVLIDTIRHIEGAPMQMSPKIVERLFQRWDRDYDQKHLEAHRDQTDMTDDHNNLARRQHSGAVMIKRLSTREREVLRLLLEKQTNKAIASTLCIAEQTVRNHISEIYSKLDVHQRLNLIDRYADLLDYL